MYNRQEAYSITDAVYSIIGNLHDASRFDAGELHLDLNYLCDELDIDKTELKHPLKVVDKDAQAQQIIDAYKMYTRSMSEIRKKAAFLRDQFLSKDKFDAKAVADAIKSFLIQTKEDTQECKFLHMSEQDFRNLCNEMSQ